MAFGQANPAWVPGEAPDEPAPFATAGSMNNRSRSPRLPGVPAEQVRLLHEVLLLVLLVLSMVCPSAPLVAQVPGDIRGDVSGPDWPALLAGRHGGAISPKLDADLDTVATLAHVKAFQEEGRFPSANTCAACHPEQYREWSGSQHAYAQMSPVFNAFHGTILRITNGTNGDFCIRCHTPVGMNLGEPVFMTNMDRNPTSREGITCVVCHRLARPFGKVSGRLAIEEGDLFDPVFGPTGNRELKRVIESPDYSVNTDRDGFGRSIHTDVEVLPQMSTSGFCGTCHDVNLVNGFRLEEAFSEYKATQAAADGVTCQDCHMASEPGRVSEYARGPAAIVGGRPTSDRKRTNHTFAGPDYSIIHPGIFPHNVRATELATIREWLTFDVAAGWGTEDFENDLPREMEFPERWRVADDRYDARDILDENQTLMDEIGRQRLAILRVGYQLGEVRIRPSAQGDLMFDVEVKNGTNGHNVPTGFDAERLVFLQIDVRDGNGSIVFQSGDRDPNGDVRDSHSLYVHNGELPLDDQLFSLQSRFLVRMVRGGEREQVLALNYSQDPLPFLRPSTRATLLLGRPVGARKHRMTIPPEQSVWASYQVKADELRGSRGPYTATIRLIAQMIPVNLVNEIKDVGFDYWMSPREVAEAVVAGAQVLWEREVTIR